MGACPGRGRRGCREQAKRGLDGEVRRRLIFHGDDECQRVTVRASDGFEHGFEQFNKIRALAVRAKECGASEHVRRALFELLELAPAATATLTSGRYEKPRANWLITKYVRGTFLGPGDKLAAADQEYPLLRWEGRVSAFARKDDGTHELSFNESITPICEVDVEDEGARHNRGPCAGRARIRGICGWYGAR